MKTNWIVQAMIQQSVFDVVASIAIPIYLSPTCLFMKLPLCWNSETNTDAF